jgi:hypothetical protein
MNLRDRSVAFTALFLGAAWGASHGCSSGGATGGDPLAQAADPDAGQTGGQDQGTCTCNCPAPSAQEPTQLKSFSEMLDALKAGKRVRAVLHYAKCQLDGSAGPDAIGGMDIGVYEYFAAGVVYNPKAYLATSENKLIDMQSSKVYNYVKLKIVEDNTVAITAQYLNPADLAVTMDETFSCAIDDGTGTKGVVLYSVP